MGETCRVVMVGMMGSGKSAVGRLLAHRTGWPLLDNDDLVLRLFDATPRQILASGGEQRLRGAESEALAMGLEAPGPSIVGAAAGTILDEANRAELRRAGTVVWLRVTPETVERRATGGAHRPWLESGGIAWIRDATAARNALYASVASITLDADSRSPARLVGEIMEHLRGVEACRDRLPATTSRARGRSR